MFAALLPPSLLLLALVLFHLKRAAPAHPPKPNLPPSPPGLPLIGNLHQLGPLLHRSLRSLSHKHGRHLMLLRLGSVPTLVVSSAEAAREVMKTQDLVFANRPSLSVARRLLYNGQDMIFVPYGEHWRQAKKLSILHVMSSRRVQSYRRVREEEVARMVERVAAESSAAGRPVNLSEVFNSLPNEVITRAIMGKKNLAQDGGGGEKYAFGGLVEQIAGLFGEFHFEDYFPYLGWLRFLERTNKRVNRCAAELDRLLEKIVTEHECAGGAATGGCGDDEKKNLVDVLVSQQEEIGGGCGNETSFTRVQIKAIILDIFAASIDTTHLTLEWAMAELLRNPEALKKAQDEIRGAVACKPTVSDDDTAPMAYLDAVLKETLRLHPPAPLLLPRESNSQTQVLGYQIPSKTRVFINVWAIGRDPRYWDSPEEFRPERFVGSDVDYRGQFFQYIPFGSGRRMCPGMSFGVATIKLALANLLHIFDWEMPDGARGEDLNMAEAPGLTARRKKPLVVLAKSLITT